jgi:hypothetical protein
MKLRRYFASSFVAVFLSLALVTSVYAGSVTKNGITLIFPDYPLTGPGLQSCEPWAEPNADTVDLTGIPEGATVTVNTIFSSPYASNPAQLPPTTYSNVTGGTLIHVINYPSDSTQWPVYDASTNERAIAVAVQVQVNAGGNITKVVSKTWWVRCLPPLAPFQGCTPGYWRQDHHFDSWVATGYAPSDDFNTVFGVSATFNPRTLEVAVALAGGGERALARHAVAALLDAAHPNINYAYTAAEVISGVQNAYSTGDFETFKSALDFANNAGCPLN